MEKQKAINKLEQIRRKKHLPINKFAQKVGVSRQSYSAWINDKFKPSYETMERKIIPFIEEQEV